MRLNRVTAEAVRGAEEHQMPLKTAEQREYNSSTVRQAFVDRGAMLILSEEDRRKSTLSYFSERTIRVREFVSNGGGRYQ